MSLDLPSEIANEIESMDDTEKMTLLAKALKGFISSTKTVFSPEEIREKAAALANAFTKFNEAYIFTPGSLVCWKDGLKNRKLPAYDEPAIVVSVTDGAETSISDKGPETPYYKEPLDLQLAIIDNDGDFVVYHYDKRRFKPWEDR